MSLTIVSGKLFSAFAVALLLASAASVSARDEPYQVLVLHSLRSSLPVNTDWYNGLVRGFASAPDHRLEIDIESPDLARFGEPNYLSNLLSIYRRKYGAAQPHLVIPTYTPALRFLLDHGEDLFPGVPIVFLGADSRFVAAQKLAPHITGITSHPDIAGTLELALHLHTDTQRVAVIVGTGNLGKEFERKARQAFQPFEGRVEFVWLRGMPPDELTEAVAKLPFKTVILYLVQLQDRTGRPSVPINTLRQLSPAANAPVYGLWDTLLGHGIVGGRLVTLEEDGFQAAQLALRILRGESPAAVPVIDRRENDAILHGGEMARWHIDQDRLPAASRIVHRQPSVWDDHGTAIVSALAIMGFQGLLILGLLLNRARLRRTRTALQAECKRRIQAEAVSLRQRGRLARFSKTRTLGAMATMIGHEISQPLIAIQNYAQAAQRRAHSDGDQPTRLVELIRKIAHQADRAGDIIQRIRNLMSTDTADLRPVSLTPVIVQIVEIIGPEIEGRGCSVDFRPAADLPAVLADSLQIQLVLVNLLQNAAHSVESMKDEADRVINLEVSRVNDGDVQVGVVDRGPGIPPDQVEHVFDALYSGGREGTGMGLAVCQMIVQAHGGRIWYTPNPSRGAIFRFTLRPAAP